MILGLGRGHRSFLEAFELVRSLVRGPEGLLTVAASTNPRICCHPSPSPSESIPRSKGRLVMRRIRDRVAGLDVHRDMVVACAQVFAEGEFTVEKQRFSTTTKGIAEL